jgi:hypothetical protein
MRLPGPALTALAAIAALPSPARAGMVFRSAPVVAAPVFRSVPMFRPTGPAPSYHVGPGFRSPVFRSAPAISHVTPFGRVGTFNPSHPWAGLPPQVRSHPFIEPQQATRSLSLPAAPRAESNLLNKLQVNRPSGLTVSAPARRRSSAPRLPPRPKLICSTSSTHLRHRPSSLSFRRSEQQVSIRLKRRCSVSCRRRVLRLRQSYPRSSSKRHWRRLIHSARQPTGRSRSFGTDS